MTVGELDSGSLQPILLYYSLRILSINYS